MRLGLLFAIVMHAAVLLLAAFYVVRLSPLPLPQEDIPVDVVDIAPVTNVKAAAPKEAEKPPEQPPAPTPAPAPPAQAQPTPQPPEKEAVLTPTEKPEPQKPEPKPEPPKPQQKPAPPADTKPKDEHFDPNAVQVLIDKAKKNAPKEQKTADAPSPGTSDQPRARVGAGTDNKASIDALIISSLRRQMIPCWNPPVGGLQSDMPVILVHIRLRPDGSLAQAPELVDQSRMGDPFYRAHAEADLRAVNKCAPFDLPKEYYDEWKDLNYQFDPRGMAGQ